MAVRAVLLLAALAATAAQDAQGDRWSRPASAERRQGDWVPLTCHNCRPVDQGAQGSSSLPSVLTPPPRVEEARLLPPPPPDGLFQTAATGFLQQFTQQQPPRKPLQFLQETSPSNRPQAQFLKSPLKQQGLVQEPSSDFQPPQPQFGLQSNRQLVNFNQQILPDQPYLNQPLFLGPQFVAAPFFPGTSIPPQNVQQINPAQVQQQRPLAPNVIPSNQNFQVLSDRPVFTQQITASSPVPPVTPQQVVSQTAAPQEQYSFNGTDGQKEEEREEVQLLYVPVETLNQRARNLGKQKSLPSNQGVAAQTVGTESNTFTSPGDNFAFSTRKPHFEDQNNFNTQFHTSKHQHVKQQFQQQLPPVDQEKFNSQIHTVREQFNVNQGDKFLQQSLPKNQENFRLEAQNTKQYNEKPESHSQAQFQQDQAFNYHVSQHQNAQVQNAFNDGVQHFQAQQLQNNQQRLINQNNNFNQNIQQDQTGFNAQQINSNQQFPAQFNNNNFQQNLPVHHQQQDINTLGLRQQFNQEIANQNQPFLQQNLPVNQQAVPGKEQPYINQPIKLNTDQPQFQQQFATQQNQQLFDVPEFQTAVPVTQTRQPIIQTPEPVTQTRQRIPQTPEPVTQTRHRIPQTPEPVTQTRQRFTQTPEPETQTRQPITQTSAPVTQTRQPVSQQIKTQRFRNPQVVEASRNTQQIQDEQFRRFPQVYQKQTEGGSEFSQASTVGTRVQNNDQRQTQQFWSNKNVPNQKFEQEASKFQSALHPVSSVAPPVTASPQPQTTLAPNQPPLSVYMETTEDTKVNDVLRLLKNAKSIQVLDTIGPDSPQVFVGPSNLNAPAGYIKFELPYLNSLDSNRVERKVDKLPFFVAPLNFNPPPGYSKIPFPAPHIGSVVVSNDTVLRTALHDKPFFNEPSLSPASSSERYQDQYTLPAQISPISPQLPSLINSLQDEIFTGSSTPQYTSTTEATTTVETYTTPYRGRGSSRNSLRGSSAYTTSAAPSRRPQTRTRRPYDGRPYSRRQPVTTPTTTLEPSTEAPIQQYTPKQEQVAFGSEDYSVQNTATPLYTQTLNNPSTSQPGITGNYYNEQFVAGGFNENQFTGQQINEQLIGNQNIQQQSIGNQNVQQAALINNSPNVQEYQQQSQNVYNGQVPAQTTPVPTVATPEVQSEDQTFRNQRPTGSRRDPVRPHQRFRGRQRLTTTTTTESYDEPSEQSIDFSQKTNGGITYQNVPNRQHFRNHDQSRLVENTHFTARVPQYSDQTERADVGLQTTEKVFPVQNEQQFVQQPLDNVQLKSQINNQFQAPATSQGVDPIINQANIQQQFQLAQAQFSQQNPNVQHSSFKDTHQVNGFDYVPATQQNIQQTNDNFQQGRFTQQSQNFREHQTQDHQSQNVQNFDQPQPEREITKPVGHAYYGQQEANPQVVTNQQQFNNEQILAQAQLDQTSGRNVQAEHVTSDQFAHVTEPSALPQETPVQTESSLPEVDNTQVNQYNQQRLVKYNRPHGRTQAVSDSSATDDQTSPRRGQHTYQSAENDGPSTSEPSTTKASLVRVRGRVRNRQRASTRVTTSIEAPNYPTTYLNRQRLNAEKEAQEYVPKKRVTYNRQSLTSLRQNQNREEDNEQSFTESNYASTDRQSTVDRFSDSSEGTTTTEASSVTKPARRYQHILNRNKIRRVRPTNTPSTSGSSGTTKFLLPTTSPPMTRLPPSRGRIRKPISVKTTTTTEYPQVNNNWNERDNFAPSAGSNEILEPLYQTKDKSQQTFGFQRTPIAPPIPQKTTQKPQAVAAEDDDDYWNQAVTIQQSTSFDFKPEGSPVTPPSFQENREQEPIWNGQIELEDGNYYDIFSQQKIAKAAHDQTPFSSDHQKVVYKDIKSRIPIGKENQYNEKDEVHNEQATEEEQNDQEGKIYPVYREITNPAETLQEETSQVVSDLYEGDGKGLVHEKDASDLGLVHEKDASDLGLVQEKDASDLPSNGDERQAQNEEAVKFEPESETKEGPLKRKIIATHPGKKGGRRRGSWVRVRVRKTQDMFETAESQNLASLSENAIPAVTKSVGDKAAWTPAPEAATEAPPTTPPREEPRETIDFEDALKDMLKEFITNPEEQKEDETEVNGGVGGDVASRNETSVGASEGRGEETHNSEDEVKEENEGVQKEEEKTGVEGEKEKKDEEVKTIVPEVTTEPFTQEPTTVFQPIDAETTIEPEVTTTPTEQTHKTRVIGTSTTTEISLETEICYRGRCVKTKKGEKASDLLTME